MPDIAPSIRPALRMTALDVVRGIALVAMILYHAVWDGLQFGLIAWSLQIDQVMLQSARAIAGSFLIIAGISMAFASARSKDSLLLSPAFWKRFALLTGSAALVSLATFFALPQAPIYFGILHHIALSSLVLALLAKLPAFFLVALGATVLITGTYISTDALNHPAVIWLGLGSQPPVTADWVPVFPWLAAGLIGFGLGKMFILPWAASHPPAGVDAPKTNVALRSLSWMGQHSLAIYLIHQPVLIGLIQAYLWLR